jgi:uncharacterized protein YlzI (FlbEa/FlbD family)
MNQTQIIKKSRSLFCHMPDCQIAMTNGKRYKVKSLLKNVFKRAHIPYIAYQQEKGCLL